VGINIVFKFQFLFFETKIKTMKDFAMIGVAALLIGGFYAFGSEPTHRSAKADQVKIYCVAATDTVPKKNDTLNKKLPTDTMSRKDTLHKRDTLQ
jgi:hypothetical protein